MSQFEYKTVLLPYKPSTFQDDATEVSALLNAESANRWRLSQIVMPSTLWGRANGIIAILERSKE
ncbi:MAG TPA: DUF4177 domain-containing protein [Steroidobacteraceae bacterium]|nr:DUF4177 domain-containing protein [Steroidobacteraceae bacterium]